MEKRGGVHYIACDEVVVVVLVMVVVVVVLVVAVVVVEAGEVRVGRVADITSTQCMCGIRGVRRRKRPN